MEVPGLAPFYRWEGKYAMVDASIADIVATLNRRGSPTWVSCSGLRADHSEDRWRSAYIGFRHISLPVVVAFIKAGFTFDDGNSVCARAFEDDGRDPATGAMGSDAMLAQKWETLRRLLS